MNKSTQYVVFALEDLRYGLHLMTVLRVVRMAEIIPLPKAPEIVMGVLNLSGQIIPVVDIRKRFRLPERELGLSDQLIVARTSKRTVALVVDRTIGVLEMPHEKIIASEKIIPTMDYVAGVVKLADGLLLIHDLDTFLSLEEEISLDASVEILRGKQ